MRATNKRCVALRCGRAAVADEAASMEHARRWAARSRLAEQDRCARYTRCNLDVPQKMQRTTAYGLRCRHGIGHYAQTSEEYVAFIAKQAGLKVAPRAESQLVELEPDNLFQAHPRSASMLCIQNLIQPY